VRHSVSSPTSRTVSALALQNDMCICCAFCARDAAAAFNALSTFSAFLPYLLLIPAPVVPLGRADGNGLRLRAWACVFSMTAILHAGAGDSGFYTIRFFFLSVSQIVPSGLQPLLCLEGRICHL